LRIAVGVSREAMSRTAIISDIHANLEALDAVLADIDRRGITDVLCLGDVVGYGPDPAECIDRVQSRCRLTIRGNHDEAVVRGPMGFNPVAREAIEWTRKVLRPRLLRPQTRQRWTFLENLPLQADWGGYVLVHGSPRDPISEYIMERDVLLGNERMFGEVFERFVTVCLVGHTHMAGVFYQGSRTTWKPQREIGGEFRFNGAKMIINVGSVGQPRDRDPRACYLTVDLAEGSFEFHRVEYDVRATQEKIYRIPPLDPQLGDRLAGGI
jgi:diadenosine tetraphosphatase ApaH/serine/threonine PP2A family protein phosphatase